MFIPKQRCAATGVHVDPWLALEIVQKNPNEIDDIHGPLVADHSMMIFLSIVLLLMAAIVLYYFWPNRRQPAEPLLTPRQEAQTSLASLRSRKITSYQLGIELSEMLRDFVDYQYGYRADRMSTHELLEVIRVTPRMSKPQQVRLRRILMQCDEMKFARCDPDQIDWLVSEAHTFVETTG
jgi:hypothetical protein